MADKRKTQADYRLDLNPKDQFGRKWLVVVEKETMDICGEALPAWETAKDRPRDPLRTPMNFVRLVRNDVGQADTSRCVVDYDAWVEQQRQATQLWYERLNENALLVYKAIEMGADLEHDPILAKLTGPKPWPSIEVVEAARDGDRQFLGLEALDREHRAAIAQLTLADLKAMPAVPKAPEITGDEDTVPDNYQDFLKWAFKKGGAKDLKQAAQLWSEHRKNLVEA